jgi:hypothetical protein
MFTFSPTPYLSARAREDGVDFLLRERLSLLFFPQPKDGDKLVPPKATGSRLLVAAMPHAEGVSITSEPAKENIPIPLMLILCDGSDNALGAHHFKNGVAIGDVYEATIRLKPKFDARSILTAQPKRRAMNGHLYRV